VFVPGKPFQDSIVFEGKARDYLSCSPLLGRLLAFHRNSELGCKYFPEANALAYFEN